MRTAIFAALAVLGITLGVSALAPTANAETHLFPPFQNEGSSN